MLKRLNEEPPGGWHYLFQGKIIKGSTWNNLKSRIEEHARINSLPMPSDEEIQKYICTKTDPSYCKSGGNKFALNRHRLTDGMRAFISILSKGKDSFVDKNTANERAKICIGCKHNVNNLGCFSCVLSEVGAGKIKQKYNLQTPYDDYIRACEICGCVLPLKVHVKADLLKELMKKSEKKKEDYPDHCWIKSL